MKLKNLRDLYIHELKDIYSAEKQLTKALAKMAKAAKDEGLATGFREHLEQTKEHVARLDQIFEQLGTKGTGVTCHAMEGLVEEGSEAIEEDAEPAVKDAYLIGAAQRIEHYEMAAYGSARSYAQALGEKDAAEVLQTTLKEEEQTDKRLTALSRTINKAAVSAASEEAEEEE